MSPGTSRRGRQRRGWPAPAAGRAPQLSGASGRRPGTPSAVPERNKAGLGWVEADAAATAAEWLTAAAEMLAGTRRSTPRLTASTSAPDDAGSFTFFLAPQSSPLSLVFLCFFLAFSFSGFSDLPCLSCLRLVSLVTHPNPVAEPILHYPPRAIPLVQLGPPTTASTQHFRPAPLPILLSVHLRR